MNAGLQTQDACAEAAEDEPQIVTIIPAPPGWWAVWGDADGEVLEPVPMFALVECAWKVGTRLHRARWSQAMTHDGEGAGTFALAERSNGYRGMRYFAPGAEPVPAWASDRIA